MSRIPKGKVSTYGDVASRAGNPKVSRYVGWVLSSLTTNESLIPWWRVVNRNGYLSIKNENLGAQNMQKAMLMDEGIHVKEDNYIADFNKYRFIA